MGMTKDQMKAVMEKVFAECMAVREDGQKEYAHDSDNCFANFERLAKEEFHGKVSREQVLWVYAMKHKDGIASWINGHRSQRESVAGRIKDLIVYLCLLRGMAEEQHQADLKKACTTDPGQTIVAEGTSGGRGNV